MKRSLFVLVLAIAAAMALLPGGRLRAEGGPSLTVTPLQPGPGDAITVKGAGLGASSDVDITFIGPGGVTVHLGKVTADDKGEFTVQYHLPADLAVGTYQVQAKGAETATFEVTVRGPGTTAESQTAPILRSRSGGAERRTDRSVWCPGGARHRLRPNGEPSLIECVGGPAGSPGAKLPDEECVEGGRPFAALCAALRRCRWLST